MEPQSIVSKKLFFFCLCLTAIFGLLICLKDQIHTSAILVYCRGSNYKTILIRLSPQSLILINPQPNGPTADCIDSYRSFYQHSLNWVFLTNMNKSNILGLQKIINRFDVKNIGLLTNTNISDVINHSTNFANEKFDYIKAPKHFFESNTSFIIVPLKTPQFDQEDQSKTPTLFTLSGRKKKVSFIEDLTLQNAASVELGDEAVLDLISSSTIIMPPCGLQSTLLPFLDELAETTHILIKQLQRDTTKGCIVELEDFLKAQNKNYSLIDLNIDLVVEIN